LSNRFDGMDMTHTNAATHNDTDSASRPTRWWSTATNNQNRNRTRTRNRRLGGRDRNRRAAFRSAAGTSSPPLRAVSPSASVPTSPTLAPVSELGSAPNVDALDLHGLQATFERLMNLNAQLNVEFAEDRDDRHGMADLPSTMDSLPFGSLLRRLMSERGSGMADFGLGGLGDLNLFPSVAVDIESLSEITAVADRLPTREITQAQEEAGGKCMICMSKYKKGDVVKTLPCIHYFHEKCIDAWFSTSHSTCPECRHSIIHNSLE